MSKHRALSCRTTAVAIAVAATAALAVPLPAARATYAGKRGPIVFQRQLNPKDDGSTQLFSLSPGTGSVRQLTHLHGGAFDPDYSPKRQADRVRSPVPERQPGRGLHDRLRRFQANPDSNCVR